MLRAMVASGKTPAREYLRVSKDRSGRLRSVDEQHGDAERAAAEYSWTLGAPYVENGAVSASRYGRKARAGFASLLADLRAGRFHAGVLVVWEPSRGSRKVSEWVALLEALEARAVLVHVTSHGRTYDPRRPRDRRSLLEDAVDAEYETGKSSDRVRRAKRDDAVAGRPNTGPPYGYQAVHDERTGRLLGWQPHPGEAPVVAELYARLERGEPLSGIARDWAARGIRSRRGHLMPAQRLWQIATNSAYGGYRQHGGQRYEATWEPLVPRSTWRTVEARLRANAAAGVRPGRAEARLLTGSAVCDVCGAGLRVRYAGRYACGAAGHVLVDAAALDSHAEQVMLAYLARPDVHELLGHVDTDDADLTRVRDELAGYRARLDALADDLDVDEATLARRARALRAKVTELEDRERTLTAPSALAGIIRPGRDVARRWKAAPMSARREAARILLTPRYLGQLRVAHGTRGLRLPVEQRVVWRQVDGDQRG